MVCPFGRSVVGLHPNRLRRKGPSSGWFSEGWVLLLGHQRSPLVGHTRVLPVDHTRGLFHGRGHPPRRRTPTCLEGQRRRRELEAFSSCVSGTRIATP